MRSRLLLSIAITLLSGLSSFFPVQAQLRIPALPRRPFHGTPIICGKKIDQFILLATVDFTPDDHFSDDWIHGFPKGLFHPVSEDADGVFYHAMNGVIVGRRYPPYEHHIQTGGIYVSKTKPGNAYGYIGDAQNPGEELTLMSARVPKPALERFMIATPAGSGKK